MAGRDARTATLFPLRRFATTGKQCALIATGDYRPSLRSPWPAAPVEISLCRTLTDPIDEEYESAFRRTKGWRLWNQDLIMRIIIN